MNNEKGRWWLNVKAVFKGWYWRKCPLCDRNFGINPNFDKKVTICPACIGLLDNAPELTWEWELDSSERR